jgi:hypothetical protein
MASEQAATTRPWSVERRASNIEHRASRTSTRQPAASSTQHPDRAGWLAPQGENDDEGAGQQQMRGCYRCVSGLMTGAGETTGMLAIGWRAFDDVVGDMLRPRSSNPPAPPDVESAGAHVEPTTQPWPWERPNRARVQPSPPGLAAGRCGMYLCSHDEAMARCKDANSCTTCVP